VESGGVFNTSEGMASDAEDKMVAWAKTGKDHMLSVCHDHHFSYRFDRCMLLSADRLIIKAVSCSSPRPR
jgi:hypothetical protein